MKPEFEPKRFYYLETRVIVTEAFLTLTQFEAEAFLTLNLKFNLKTRV